MHPSANKFIEAVKENARQVWTEPGDQEFINKLLFVDELPDGSTSERGIMLLIAICFEEQVTCSCKVSPVDVNPHSAKECLEYICKSQVLPKGSVDEVLVIINDEVVHQYTSEHWS